MAHNPNKWMIRGALLALAGFVLSGPVAVALVTTLHPQPQWQSAEYFVRYYHPLQLLPYLMGFVLVAGLLLMMAGIYHRQQNEADHGDEGFYSLMALCLAIVFSAVIFLNYIIQVVFVHQLASHYRPGYAPLITGFTMANPASLGWTIEMWGYAVLGAATWMLSNIFKPAYLKNLLRLNTLVSILPALWMIIDSEWMLTRTGMILYAGWNVLMIVILISIYYTTTKRETWLRPTVS
jgi:hypothetical protein